MQTRPNRKPQKLMQTSVTVRLARALKYSVWTGAVLNRAYLSPEMKRGEAIPPGSSSFPPKSHPQNMKHVSGGEHDPVSIAKLSLKNNSLLIRLSGGLAGPLVVLPRLTAMGPDPRGRLFLDYALRVVAAESVVTQAPSQGI